MRCVYNMAMAISKKHENAWDKIPVGFLKNVRTKAQFWSIWACTWEVQPENPKVESRGPDVLFSKEPSGQNSSKFQGSQHTMSLKNELWWIHAQRKLRSRPCPLIFCSRGFWKLQIRIKIPASSSSTSQQCKNCDIGVAVFWMMKILRN